MDLDMEAYYSDMENLDDDELMNYFEQEEMYSYDDTVYQQLPLWQQLDTCVLPVVQQTLTTILPLAVACFISKLVASLTADGRSETAVQRSIVHISSSLFGLWILYNFFQSTMVYLLVTASCGYLVITVAMFKCRPLCGVCVSATIVLIIILLELFIVDSASWHKIRGSQMIMSMKIISLAFDVSDSAVNYLPDIWQYHGYVFNVGTVIFGPWISFHQYCSITQQDLRPMNLPWLFKLIKSIVSALICLVMSTCVMAILIQDHHWKWLTAFRDAMSFRFSHYFVSYLSTLSLTLNGLGATHNTNGQVTWDFAVTRPTYIEVPRSLVETVSNWNIPMHHWLKNYVFKIARPLGNFVAVLLTYAASSLLHGLNFQLAAVLLSLAFYSYVEYVLRQKLAKIYDACIMAKKCKDNCSHSTKWNHPYVMFTNLAFSLLSVFHLAYLGLMFDSSSQEEKGYDMQHTLDKWSSLGYLSHWVASGTFLFHVLI